MEDTLKRKFTKIGLDKSEIERLKNEISESFRPSFKNWKLLFFALPTFLLLILIMLQSKVELDEQLIFSALKFFAILTIGFYTNVMACIYELKLKYKLTRKVLVKRKIDIFIFKVIIPKGFFPLILFPQNEIYQKINQNDEISIELTALYRWLRIQTA